MDEDTDGTGDGEQLRRLARKLDIEEITLEQSTDRGRSVQDDQVMRVSESVRRSMAADGLGEDLASTPPDGLDSVDTTRPG
jgi:hypothetical protein